MDLKNKKISELPKGAKRFRTLMGWLDEIGENYHIERVSKTEFILSLNFENIRRARTRQTLNNQLIKRYSAIEASPEHQSKS